MRPAKATANSSNATTEVIQQQNSRHRDDSSARHADAGLPCLPFIDSAWSLAFGVLPPYWAAKAFWVATDHVPYVVAGAVYNVMVSRPLFRRFVAKNT